MRVVFVHPTDPYSDYDAITNYIRGILKHIGNAGVYCGVPRRQGNAYPGNAYPDLEGFTFRPLFSRSRKLFVPTTLKYQYRLLIKRPTIPIQGGILSVHEVEWALPLLYPRKIGPVVLTIHGASKFMRLATKNRAKILYHELADKLAIKRADRVILVSRDAYDFYQTKYPRLKEKFVYVPTFVDDALFYPCPDRAILRQNLGLAPNDVVIMYVGRFVPEKGLDLLLAAFRELQRAIDKLKLILIGDGPMRSFLRDIISAGMNNIYLWGPYAHHVLPQILNCADLLVLPSLFEATPLVVLEALACGVPVVAFPVGDLPKIIVSGLNGYLVQHRTAAALADGIKRCIQLLGNPPLEACVQSVYEYRASKIVPQILEVYKEVWQEAQRREGEANEDSP